MFIPYSADIPYERSAWISYVLFPLILLLTGMQAGRSGSGDFLYPSVLNSPNILILFFVLCNLVLLWFFGRFVCARIGGWSYATMVIVLSVVSQLINQFVGGVTVLSLSCIVNFLTGMYIVFWPLNQIDCFILVPPFKTFSVSGLWVILPWLLLNALAAELGETFLFYLTELSTVVLGGVIAAGLLKFRIIDMDKDDGTLLQIFSKTQPDDPAWSESWSIRRENVKNGDNSPEKPLAMQKNKEECISVLCKCGNIVEVSIKAKNNVVCSECSRKVRMPNFGRNPRSPM